MREEKRRTAPSCGTQPKYRGEGTVWGLGERQDVLGTWRPNWNFGYGETRPLRRIELGCPTETWTSKPPSTAWDVVFVQPQLLACTSP